ncbi:S-adenosylmethionine:tRNA ribosyltransferase-isomerase [Terrimicrobium sacchariphilum]|uniref:S-adenosylmethionine:tRNA ribosyltransferase-isomerase n=1 Tax=Terrimicrobium sacchariphilum TaxID=690879 RepID=A0A146GDF3_TERSA|nr:tRNA preQ1(34) S-adenosylmethionine ribosyltransferase-isomerase QueA [Terrimicrobium sacchariphilum]GAT34764.1 S-adenosylmethionine:tRNA ribosyltransferase-isomerase [Terrimicrobium sacchariphilum]
MLVSDFDFDLPPELIASRPLPDRDGSRMMVVDRSTGEITHRSFRDFPSYLAPGDLVVLNDSRVIKARLRTPDQRTELLLLEPVDSSAWKCLGKPGRRLRIGMSMEIAGTVATVRDILPDGERVVEFASPPDLQTHGAMPIPPYFRREADAEDDVRYQTVFADEPGSVAAPTAGLHFTPELLSTLPHAFLTLHVGIGTFLPVKVDRVADHVMHEERYSISPEAAQAINAAKRIVAIGTTASRVLESQPAGPIQPHSGSTAIFIHPGYHFKHVGALLTNFHLPKSTLIMLVSALAGTDLIRRAYEEAVRERYRFFSYGDCMLVV